MVRKKQTQGPCVYCGREMTRSGLGKHLQSCPKRQAVISAISSRNRDEQLLYHLQVQDAWQGDFWLHLEMPGSASLDDLDHYLRAIWLECCGHLSRFSVGGWDGNEIAMDTLAKQVFRPGIELIHIYDFGTSSETLIKVVAVRDGRPTTSSPLTLMARNHPPEVGCMLCDQSATWLCMECVYEHDDQGTLCDRHVRDHPHDDYGGSVPFVNSPRTGMCGYEGPAEAPY